MEFKKSVHIDVTEHERTPAEESFYESYLLKKHSDVGNLYASNVYQGQCFQKTLKHINRERSVQAAEIDREMKKVKKKMFDLKMKSSSNRILGQRQFSFDCVRNIKMNGLDDCHGDILSFPVIGGKGRNPKRGERRCSRTLSDSSNRGLNAIQSGSLRSSSARQVGKSLNKSEGSIINYGDGRPSSSQSDGFRLSNTGGFKNSKTNSVPVVFVTEIAEPASVNPSSSLREKCRDRNSEQNDQGKPSSKASLQKQALSPIHTTKINPRDGLTHSTSESSLCLNGRLRPAKSHQDLACLDSAAPIERRPRSHTISGCSKAGPEFEGLEMRYVPREDRVKSASTGGLPKI
ncbi:uncharacterized protein LOC135696163 isoform X1 [Rhopilema esculentum]|uniref:uncharacterized protein LOC135696163 isoform X1 n=1 Tax=Rhopilema esculentum TaxID=499914 RepID=UPI0031D893D3